MSTYDRVFKEVFKNGTTPNGHIQRNRENIATLKKAKEEIEILLKEK